MVVTKPKYSQLEECAHDYLIIKMPDKTDLEAVKKRSMDFAAVAGIILCGIKLISTGANFLYVLGMTVCCAYKYLK